MPVTRTGVELVSMEYHQDSDGYRTEYNRDAVPASLAVVASLSEVMDVDPTELEPLHNVVDTDALDVFGRAGGSTNGAIRTSFTFEGYGITVSSDGTVEVSPPEHERTDGQTDGTAGQ